MPIFILVFGFMFAVFSLFKLKSKTLTALKQFTKKNLTEDGATEKAKMDGQALFADKNKEVKEKVDISEEQQNIVQEILKGEREILLELEEIKKREKRNKLGNSANIFSGKAALMEQERNQRQIMIEMATNNNNAKQAQ